MISERSTCERVQMHLVEGELPSALLGHLEACAECAFVQRLSKRFDGPSRPASTSGRLGPALDALLERAMTEHAPILERFRIESVLGVGGQGRVYRAIDLEAGDAVALKIVRVGDAGVASEVANARRIRHPNVCRVFHVERHGDLRIIVMELVDGPTLAAALDGLDRAARRRMILLVCDAVQAAHDAGVLHLDLKPSNVMLRDGAPIVMDFGLSSPVSGARAVGGTPRYMAPEQAAGARVDVRTDVFALGRLLADVAVEHRFKGVVRRATSTEPERRYATAREVRHAIELRSRVGWALLFITLVGLSFAGVALWHAHVVQTQPVVVTQPRTTPSSLPSAPLSASSVPTPPWTASDSASAPAPPRGLVQRKVVRTPPPPSATTTTDAACDPPYTIDSLGDRHFKQECL